jgi:proline dehydrogenase
VVKALLRSTLLALSRNDKVEQIARQNSAAQTLVNRFVAGTSVSDAVRVSQELADSGRLATADYLGEDTTDIGMARNTAAAYIDLLTALGDLGLASRVEVSIKLSALGLSLPVDGISVAQDLATEICAKAEQMGTTVTVDMEDHTTTDNTLEIVRSLRADFPDTGLVLQAYLHRTQSDCVDLSYPGSRIRLCKGAYREPSTVAYQDKHQIDVSYVRCMAVLLAGSGYPMFATHDPRLIEIAGSLVVKSGREQGTYEYQMLYGIRPDEQLRLAAAGERMRVYVPFGQEWYGYLMRRLAERPANLGLLARTLTSKG